MLMPYGQKIKMEFISIDIYALRAILNNFIVINCLFFLKLYHFEMP